LVHVADYGQKGRTIQDRLRYFL